MGTGSSHIGMIASASSLVPSALPDAVLAASVHVVHDTEWYDKMAALVWDAMSLCPPAPSVRHAYGHIETTPRSASWVIALADEISDVTMLDDDECVSLLERIISSMDGRDGRHAVSATSLLFLAKAYAVHADCEPRWHYALRGDVTPVSQQAWRMIMDVRDDAIGIVRLRGMHEHAPRVIAREEHAHKGFTRQFTVAVDDAIARYEKHTMAYDAMGNPV